MFCKRWIILNIIRGRINRASIFYSAFHMPTHPKQFWFASKFMKEKGIHEVGLYRVYTSIYKRKLLQCTAKQSEIDRNDTNLWWTGFENEVFKNPLTCAMHRTCYPGIVFDYFLRLSQVTQNFQKIFWYDSHSILINPSSPVPRLWHCFPR